VVSAMYGRIKNALLCIHVHFVMVITGFYLLSWALSDNVAAR
jgi:hypothetical protein